VALNKQNDQDFAQPLRRVFVAILAGFLILLFLVWRIDNPRVERFRTAMLDRFIPSFEWVLVPLTGITRVASDFQSFTNIYQQNQELRREIQRLKAWKETAIQFEAKYAKLLDLNKVRINNSLTFVSGVVLADSGSPFRQSVLLNVGLGDGIVDGWATMDGLGLVGRISGVADRTSRVILLTDTSSNVPVTIQPSGQRAILSGDNTAFPALDLVQSPEIIRPADRVVTSGDGGVFPAGLLVGKVVVDTSGRQRVQLSADYRRLEFLRVLRGQPAPIVAESEALIGIATHVRAKTATVVENE
jgi:rod shape-determining protein MreC